MRVRRGAVAVLALLVAVTGAAADAGAGSTTKKIKPKAGAYVGKITSGDAKGTEVRFIYATFEFDDGKDRKAISLFQGDLELRCDDGTTQSASGSGLAPLKGTKFSGRNVVAGTTTTIKGKFTTSTKISGTLRLKTQDCDSGTVKFTAARHVE